MQQINVEKCPFSKWCWDLNPQPLEHESSPIVTRQGLPPIQQFFLPPTVAQLGDARGPRFESIHLPFETNIYLYV